MATTDSALPATATTNPAPIATIDPASPAPPVTPATATTNPASATIATLPSATVPQATPTTVPTLPTSQTSADPKTSTSTTGPTNTETTNTPAPLPSNTTPVLEKEELDFSGNVDVNDDLPSAADLKRVGDLLLLDADGVSRPFKELYTGKGVAPRQLVIFVRHFFCGNCQEYLRTLSSSITPESLLTLPTPTFITVIGCGRPELIPMYVETTSCPFPVYADPTHKLYDYLGMTRTLNLGKKPNYIHSNLFVTSIQSVVQSLKTGDKALKGGDFKQVGGEFLFENGQCTWVHRMRNTRDHAEIPDLRRVIGLDDSKPPVRKRWSHGIKEVKPGRRSSSWGRMRASSKSKGTKDKDGLGIREKEGSLTGTSTPDEVAELEEDMKALEMDAKLSGKPLV